MKKEKWIDPATINKVDGESTVVAGIDNGSTHTRVSIARDEGVELTYVSLESGFSVPDNTAIYVSQDGELLSNLEINLEDITEDKSNKVFENVTIFKERLFKASGTLQKGIANSDKVLQAATYINILSALAVAFLNGTNVFGRYRVKLGTSLPPMDYLIDGGKEVEKNLIGIYRVSFPRLKVSFEIEILREFICTFNESNCSLQFVMNNGLANPAVENFFVADGGGTTIDFAGFVDRLLKSDASYTTRKFGESYFIHRLRNKLMSRGNRHLPLDEAPLSRALQVGYIQQGDTKTPVKNELHSIRVETAEGILAEFQNMLRNTNIQLYQLQKLILVGGLFSELKNSGEVISADYSSLFEDFIVPKGSVKVIFGGKDINVVQGLMDLYQKWLKTI